MDSKGHEASKLYPETHFAKYVQSHQPLMDEVLQLLEKTKASLDVAHSFALQISDSAESFKVFVLLYVVIDLVTAQPEVQTKVNAVGTSFSKFKSATKVDEKLVVGEAISNPNDEVVHEMLKIFVPQLFTEK
ncbi:ferrochelatase 1 [Striga asiatica]|uniref:Ferrochelatase 1 n=1 Tax=Striga asiatica TaxID=4170 RepID=A0A5A7Q8F5_STRAF|nr:ferrochelatase 1 [Striga asiatica]